MLLILPCPCEIIAKLEGKKPSEKPKTIIEYIKKYTKCNDEQCWIKSLPIHLQHNIINYIYRPVYPKEWNNNKNEWLSNFDILAVIQQYEDTYPHFKFIGPTFIDFDTKLYNDKCVENDLCKFDISAYENSEKNKIGIIFASAIRDNLVAKFLKIDYAKIAQLVERDLAKVEVAGSSPVFRSITYNARVVKLVDTLDLKSSEQQCSCGFKSRSEY